MMHRWARNSVNRLHHKNLILMKNYLASHLAEIIDIKILSPALKSWCLIVERVAWSCEGKYYTQVVACKLQGNCHVRIWLVESLFTSKLLFCHMASNWPASRLSNHQSELFYWAHLHWTRNNILSSSLLIYFYLEIQFDKVGDHLAHSSTYYSVGAAIFVKF